jgi:hypothetical protein
MVLYLRQDYGVTNGEVADWTSGGRWSEVALTSEVLGENTVDGEILACESCSDYTVYLGNC